MPITKENMIKDINLEGIMGKYRKLCLSGLRLLLFVATLVAISPMDIFSQNYEFTLNPRRAFDRLYVEIWAKSLSATAPKLGYGSLVIRYNTNFLVPSAVQMLSTTDSINTISASTSTAVVNVSSQFNGMNGYQPLASQSYTLGYYSLELTLDNLGSGGIVPSSSGRGSFIGRLSFDIIGNPSDTALANISWSKTVLPGDVRAFDINGNDIENQITWTDPSQSYTVTGLTILSPNQPNMVVDRDGTYAVLTGEYADGGYPVYFERSINPSTYTIPVGTAPALDEDLAYSFDYSLDNGTNWIEFGRVTETDRPASSVANANYRTGEIFEPKAGGTYLITTQGGSQIGASNFRQPLRVVWKKNPYFAQRSEQARLRIRKLAGSFGAALTTRAYDNPLDINDFSFTLGRLFFLQLNGTNQYLKTKNNFSNPTQITVEAWVNLNATQAAGSEPAIVALSGGPEATPTFNSNEGAWMLYLKDGNQPAFRAREILARGTTPQEIYIGEVVGSPINAVSAAAPLTTEHSQNWVHIAATVKDNQMILYVNGEIADELTNTNANDIRMMTTSQPIWIGVNPNTAITPASFLNMGVKSVRIWRNALEQDEIRRLASGVVNPSKIETYEDLRKGLELYYSFEGTNEDLANDIYYQNNKNEVNLVQNGTIQTSLPYRPDMPHLKITAPMANSGVLNKATETTEIRWIGYGLGDIAALGSKDLEIEYSIDGGTTWTLAKTPAGNQLTGNNSPDLEATKSYWTPYLNNDASANLRTINPYSRDTWLRIRGTSANTQETLSDVSGPFTVAPFFAIRSLEGSQMFVRGTDGMNITGDNAFFEAWIRPYRFPTEAEDFFPIFEKSDPVLGFSHYSLKLLSTGQLQFDITEPAATVRTAISNPNKPLVRPNSVDNDSAWTHIAVLLLRNGDDGDAEVRFYIDGVVQSGTELGQQIGNAVDIAGTNKYPLYIGSNPEGEISFVGEIKEVRLWRGIPNNYSVSGAEPTQLTTFVQGSQSILADSLPSNLKVNLHSIYSFNGGSFAISGWNRAVAQSNNNLSIVRHFGTPVKFVPAKPFIKLVEPAFRSSIENGDNDVSVRWVGNYYDGQGFATGTINTPPSLEFSIRGGGGDLIQPYQYIGSDYWVGNLKDAISLPNEDRYRFNGTGKTMYYALSLNAAIGDPDENNDGSFIDQGPLSASLTNARLRLKGKYTINGETANLETEGPLFTITPSSNFTVRLMLEGYHRGATAGVRANDLASTFDRGGLRIQLYSDNANEIGTKIGPVVESKQGFAERDPANRLGGNNKYGNVNFVFTDLTNGSYWVLVEHLNHLPIMSRFPAPFQFTGDLPTTWGIESGWDFLSWNGNDNNVLPNSTTNPWLGSYYTARGNAVSTKTKVEYSTTGLIFNGGQLGNVAPLPAMVAGDTQRDGQINAADRVLVRQDDGTSNPRSDVTGEGFVNGLDRTITDRNFGKVSSVYNDNLDQTAGIVALPPVYISDPMSYIAESDRDMSEFFVKNAESVSSKNIIRKDENQTLAGGLAYKVSAKTKVDTNYVDVDFYIQNLGSNFGLANCTFAISYNTSTLTFNSLRGSDSVIFSNKPAVGYSNLRTAPTAASVNPLPEVRTIEVDYDAFANLGGVNVPSVSTYLGTLRFNIKDKKGIVNFAWHDSKVVITTDGRDATEYGTFEVIPSFLLYNAEVQSPNGGEKYAQKKKQTIKWISNGTAPVFIEFTSNAGTNWTKLNTEQVAANGKEYQWTTPDITSSFCLIRIVDAQSGIELDRSNAYFAIVPNFAQIVRPSTSDAVYQGGSSDKIRWNAQGPDCIRFEFSSDGGTTWKSVVSNTNPSLTEISWKVPSVTTKTAVVRMIDCDTELELARSGYFKILYGGLTFTNPRAGETYIATKYHKIAWNYANLTQFDLQLSTDGGSTWEEIQNDVQAKTRTLNWLVPERPTETAVVRGLWNRDPEMEYGRTGIFRIITFTSVDDFEDIPIVSALYPNPASSNVFMQVSSHVDTQVDVLIINPLGSVVLTKNVYLNAEANLIELDLSALPSGTYYVVLQGKDYKAMKELMIVR